MATKFILTDKVVDLDGRKGAVVKVTEWEGSTWYDVRFGPSGTAVRYDSDLERRLWESL